MRLLAKQRLPGPIFHYIDGAADDEVTYRRNTQAFEECDLVPNVLAGVENVDMSVTVMGVKLDMPIFCSPTALQRLFHHDGERAVARAAEKFGTMFGVSSLGTVSVEEIGSMIQNAEDVSVLFPQGSRVEQRDDRPGQGSQLRCVGADSGHHHGRAIGSEICAPVSPLRPGSPSGSLVSFALHPRWAVGYYTHEKFELSQLKDYVKEGSNMAVSVGEYFSTMLDQSMSWKDAEELRQAWSGQFCLKGIMSVADAKRAVEIGATRDHGVKSWRAAVRRLAQPFRSAFGDR